MVEFNTGILFCVVILIQFHSLDGDLIFTSPIRTKRLFSTVDGVIQTLEDYIAYEEGRLDGIDKQVDEWKREHDRNAENPEENLANHIALFNFLKKLQTWWSYMHDRAKENSAHSFLSDLKKINHFTWPTEGDMTGVMDSTINLQQVYHMDAGSIAKGVFHGVSTNSSLCFEECFMMSKRCFETVHHEFALQWSTVALQKYFDEHVDDKERLSKLLYIISYCSYVTGQHDIALESITTYMKSNPNDAKGRALQDMLSVKLPADHEKNLRRKEIEIWNKYKNLCCKFTTKAELSSHSHLKCRYNYDNYFLCVAPLKEEILSVNPKLVLFRDVIYDSEIEFLKKESKYRLNEMIGDEESNLQYENTSVAHFEDLEIREISRLPQRIQDMAASHVEPNGEFHLFKFDLGGSFLDSDPIQSTKNNKNVNVKPHATVLFHLNDVIQGGSTVFPKLGIAVEAEKGTALVWFEEIQNQFASCATIVGYKWILTKVI